MQRRRPLQPKPQQNDVKSVLHFAWLPTVVGDTLVWLERYEVVYLYESRQVVAVIEGKPRVFDIGKWTEVTRSVIKRKD